MGSKAGKFVVVAIFLIALALGSYGWWFNFQQGRKAAGLWGPEMAVLLRFAPQVELLILEVAEKGSAADETVTISNQPYSVTESREISQVKGLVHARHALIQDASYDWEGVRPGCDHSWPFGLRFTDKKGQQAILVFDPNCNTVLLVETGREGLLQTEVMEAYVGKRDDWLEE